MTSTVQWCDVVFTAQLLLEIYFALLGHNTGLLQLISFSNQQPKYQLTNTRGAQAWLGYRCNSAMTAHRPPSSVMCSNYDIDWPVHSLMLSLRGLRLRRPPPTVPCSMIFSSVSLSWWQTWPNHDSLRRLMVGSKSFWRPARILTCCHTYSFVWYAKHSPVAFVFRSRLSKSAVSVQFSHPWSSIDNTSGLPSLIFVGKLMPSFFQRSARLVMAESACATVWSLLPLLMFRLWCVASRYLNWSISSSVFPFIHMLVDGLGLRLLAKILLMLELISMPQPAAVFSSVSVSCSSSTSLPPSRSMSSAKQIVKRSSSNGHWREWDVNFFCFFYCITCKAVVLQ